jgi:hypothetical protein
MDCRSRNFRKALTRGCIDRTDRPRRASNSALKLTATLKPTPSMTRLLASYGEDEILRVALPPRPALHPLAAPALLEGLSLWYQRPRCVVLCVDAQGSSSRLRASATTSASADRPCTMRWTWSTQRGAAAGWARSAICGSSTRGVSGEQVHARAQGRDHPPVLRRALAARHHRQPARRPSRRGPPHARRRHRPPRSRHAPPTPARPVSRPHRRDATRPQDQTRPRWPM